MRLNIIAQAFSWLIQCLNNVLGPRNSNSQAPIIPLAALPNIGRGIHDPHSSPGLSMQIGAPLSQVWLINISPVRRPNRSQIVVDYHAQTQQRLNNVPNPNFGDSNHVSQSRQLAKMVLVLVVPITELLLDDYKGLTPFRSRFLAIVLSLGFTVTLNGMLLEGSSFQRIASVMEKLGIALIYLGYFGLISSHLPPSLEWICWMCFALSCVHLVLRHVPLPKILTDYNSNSPRRPQIC